MNHFITDNNQTSRPAAAESRDEKLLREAMRLAESGRSDQALAVLNRSNMNTDAIRNTRGVCLLRLGRAEDALRIFRSLVLAAGNTWMKRDLPVVYRTNFCTALLLTGRAAGCWDALTEIDERDHPSVVRLRETLDRWRRGLKGWSWLVWKMGSDPSVPVTLDFVAGDFGDPQNALSDQAVNCDRSRPEAVERNRGI